MIVRMVWPDCDFQNGRWVDTPIDSFWVECTPAEVASQLVPRLSPPQRAHLDELHRQQAEPATSTFVLVAQDLSSIQPMESHYPYSNQWNAYSPFRAVVPLEISDLTDLATLDVIALLVGPQSPGDAAFAQRMRFHQSWYRANQLGLLYGTGPTVQSDRPYGNMLRPEDAAQGVTFLSPTIFAAAKQRMARKDGLIDQFRLLHNLLASQAMCFNLFGPFVDDPNRALPLVRAMLPDAVERVTRVELEYAPQPANDYLGDNTAFDAFIEYIRSDGQRAFAGIETKLSEPFSRTRYESERYATLTQRPDSPWPSAAWPTLPDVGHNQLWRDHLLVVAMLAHPATPYTSGRLVLVRHPQDTNCEKVVAGYRALLRPDEQSFLDLPLDQLVAAWRSAVPQGHDSWRTWLGALEERYLRLEDSKADWHRWKAWTAK